MAYESESLQVGGDPNDSKSSANLLSVGEWMRGNLASVDDVDFFKFTIASPGLLTLNFDGADPKRSAISWKIDVLDANLDYVRTLSSTAAGTQLTAAAGSTSKSITVSGLTTAAKAGDRFTTVTTSADSKIYTVVEATVLKSGSQTLTLDSDWTATTDTTILFDPAQLSATGALSSLSTTIAQAGTYYLKVSSAAFTDTTYAFKLGFEGALETDLNTTKEQAVTENSRLVPDLFHQGQVSTSDTDVWLLSTASGGTFKLDFAAGSNDANTAFNLKVETWTRANGTDVLTGVTSRGQAVSGAVTGSKSIEIDSTAYPNSTSFVVTVTATSVSGSATGAYTLKASGSGLDINDTPLIQVGSYTSGKPDELLDLSQLTSVSVGAGKELALSSLLSASDADDQTLTYKFTLVPGTNSSASGSIKLKQSDGSWTSYTNGAAMAAADLAKAYVVADSNLGALQLDAQVVDSSGLPDNSGTSGLVRLKLQVVSSAAGVTTGDDGSLSLTEGTVSGSAGYEEALTFKLNEAPGTDEVVTLRLVDTDKQLILDKTALTFNASNYNQTQTVKVRALSDNKDEGSHTAKLNFTLTSNTSGSSYSGLQLNALTFTLADPSNSVATGSVTVSGDSKQGQEITADTSAVADADGVGNFNYLWQRTKDDGVNWTDISNATNDTYTLALADALGKVRVVVSFIDGKGNLETLNSAATDIVEAGNVPPTTTDSEVLVLPKTGFEYHFKLADFPFADDNSTDSFASITLLNLPTGSLLRYAGQAITTGSSGFSIDRADISKLSFALPDGKVSGDVVINFSFQVVDSAGGVSETHILSAKVDQLATAVYMTPGTSFETSGLTSYAKSTGLSSRMSNPVGLDASLKLADGTSSALVSLVVDNSLDANGYWVKDTAGYWVNLATEVGKSEGLTTLKVQIEDGGKYDIDVTPGEVSQTAVIAHMPLSVVGVTPDTTEDGHWF